MSPPPPDAPATPHPLAPAPTRCPSSTLATIRATDRNAPPCRDVSDCPEDTISADGRAGVVYECEDRRCIRIEALE